MEDESDFNIEVLEELDSLEPDFASFKTPAAAVRWYQDAIRKLGLNRLTPVTALRSGIGEFVNNLRLGDMYMFMYDPKTKESLPYYDMAPLVIMFNKTPDGFIGLNLHYISPLSRQFLLNRLLKYTTTKTISEQTRFRLTWSLLSQYPDTDVCVKRYLYNNLQSRILKISPEHWQKAIMLPVDKFANVSKQKLYADARRRR